MRTTSFALGLLAATASAQKNLNGVNAPEVIELIDGFMLGALDTEKIDSLDTCVMDMNPMVIDMVNAVNDFEDGSYHAIADGIYNLGQFISQVGIVMEDCVAISESDVSKLKEMGEAFEHPKQLIIDAENNVIMNGVEIYKDVRTALTDMKDSKYEQAGKKWGDVAALVLYGQANMVITQ